MTVYDFWFIVLSLFSVYKNGDPDLVYSSTKNTRPGMMFNFRACFRLEKGLWTNTLLTELITEFDPFLVDVTTIMKIMLDQNPECQ